MEFEATCIRDEGRIKPRHLLWAAKQRGQLFIDEGYDPVLRRVIRTARLRIADADLLPPLYDVIIVSAKPDWWVLSGWERCARSYDDRTNDYAQSWLMVPVAAS